MHSGTMHCRLPFHALISGTMHSPFPRVQPASRTVTSAEPVELPSNDTTHTCTHAQPSARGRRLAAAPSPQPKLPVLLRSAVASCRAVPRSTAAAISTAAAACLHTCRQQHEASRTTCQLCGHAHARQPRADTPPTQPSQGQACHAHPPAHPLTHRRSPRRPPDSSPRSDPRRVWLHWPHRWRQRARCAPQGQPHRRRPPAKGKERPEGSPWPTPGAPQPQSYLGPAQQQPH
jgi:hypothetical protein